MLTPDELLTTTRSVRKRLDLTRPVERTLIEECLRIAQQAPTASNQEDWQFVVVTEAGIRQQLARLYRRGADAILGNPNYALNRQLREDGRQQVAERVISSAVYLAEHLQDVPVHVIPCVKGRPEGRELAYQASIFGSILPATWSFMLAARARGLGTCWTTLHLLAEEEAAHVLGIPFESVAQVALIPVAYYTGGEFGTAQRDDLRTKVHWQRW